MAYPKGFFRIVGKEDGLYLVVSLKEKGEKLLPRTIVEYLDRNDIDDYDEIRINAFLKKVSKIEDGKKFRLKISEKTDCDIDEQVDIRVTEDNLKAIMVIYPPVNDGKVMNLKQIEEKMDLAGIKAGIKLKSVAEFVKKRKYERRFLIAEGTKAVQGKEPKIEYKFPVESTLVPKVNEDGSVDFRDLNNIHLVKKDELLAELIPGEDGSDGMDVYGQKEVVEKYGVKKLKVKENVYLSGDGLKVFAAEDGHVELTKDGCVKVSTVYVIEDDIGSKTGNIEFNGNLCIMGNVLPGYNVKAAGNIKVTGTIEGAIVEADGSVIIDQGIGGNKRSMVRAKEDIISKFIENAAIISEKKVVTEMILHSNVSAGTVVDVKVGKGSIVGGKVSALEAINCKTAGSNMVKSTVLQVGKNVNDKDVLQELMVKGRKMKKELDKMEKDEATLKKKLRDKKNATEELKKQYEELVKAKEDLEITIFETKATCDEMERLLDQKVDNNNVYITVDGKIKAGVAISIAGATKIFRGQATGATFIRKDGEVSEKGNY